MEVRGMKLSPISIIPILVVFDLMVAGLAYAILLSLGVIVDFWLVTAVLLAAAGLSVIGLFFIDLHRKDGEA
jgi:hypothetical protein